MERSQMKKNTKITLIVIIAIIVASCIFSAFIYIVYVADFCPNADDNVSIPVGCIVRFPEKYADKYVKVIGKYDSYGIGIWKIDSERVEYELIINGSISGPSFWFANPRIHLHFSVVNGTDISMLIEDEEYYWYGLFRFTDDVDAGGGLHYAQGMFLEVSKVEPI
jgi:hypothetical protein